MLKEFRALLQISPITINSHRLLQLISLNMYAIACTELKGESKTFPLNRSAQHIFAESPKNEFRCKETCCPKLIPNLCRCTMSSEMTSDYDTSRALESQPSSVTKLRWKNLSREWARSLITQVPVAKRRRRCGELIAVLISALISAKTSNNLYQLKMLCFQLWRLPSIPEEKALLGCTVVAIFYE